MFDILSQTLSSNRSRPYLRFIFIDKATIWFRLTLLVPFLYGLSIIIDPGNFISAFVRQTAGIIILFLLSGSVTYHLFFGDESPLIIEQLVFSIGISIIITLLVAVTLNFSFLGLHPTSIFSTVLFYIIAVSFFATRRDFKKISTR